MEQRLLHKEDSMIARNLAISIMAMLLLASACVPKPEQEEEKKLSEREREAALVLFETLTSPEFIASIDSDLSVEDCSVMADIELVGFGEASATGSIALRFPVDKDGMCEAYLMDGDILSLGIPIEIVEATGRTDGLSFEIIGDSARIVSQARLRYPLSGRISIGGSGEAAVLLFPDDQPFIPQSMLDANEEAIVQQVVAEAFAAFASAPDGTATESFSDGMATLSWSSESLWDISIMAKRDGIVIAVTIDSREGHGSVIFDNESYRMEAELLMAKAELPKPRMAAMDYLEALRVSNMVFALRDLINGSRSSVIALDGLEWNDGDCTASLSLDGYGLSNGMRASGGIDIRLVGSGDGSTLRATDYIADSDRLSFTGGERDAEASLSAVSGPFEGEEPPIFTIMDEEGGFAASCGADLIFGYPESGSARCDEGTIEF